MSGYNPYGGNPPQYPSPQSIYPNLIQQNPTAPPSSYSYPQGQPQQQQPGVSPSSLSYSGEPHPSNPPQLGFNQYPGQPSGQPQYPGGQPQYPGGQPQYPGGQQQYPGGQPQYPGGQSQYPGGQQQIQPTPPQYPGGQPLIQPTPPQYPGQHQIQPTPVQYPGQQPIQPTQYPGSYTQQTPTPCAPHPDSFAGLVEWVPTTPQHAHALSNRAIVAGPDNDGSPLWVIRAKFEGDVIPGKLAVKHKAAYVPWGGKENAVQQIEVCCCDRPERIRWLPSQNGMKPPTAIRGGTTASGDNLFIGRASHYKSVTPGKIHQGHQAMYISFGGKEISYKNYEVLCGA